MVAAKVRRSVVAGSPIRITSIALPKFPYDPDSVAVAIGQALSMPLDERRKRHKSLFEVLSQNDVQYWAARFLGELEREPAPLSRLDRVLP
jgi:trehalose 6-phosphate synthase